MREELPSIQVRKLVSLLREELNEMMAAANELGGLLSMSPKELGYLSVINRGLCRQLRLARHLDLECQLHLKDEINLSLKPVDLVELCRELTAQVKSIVGILQVRIDFQTNLLELVTNADRARLEDMLLFLISNAVKAVGTDGDILLTLEKRGGRAILMLADNGGGLSSAAKAGFFGLEEENQLSEEISMGMGLPLARKIAGLHGGLIIADSHGEEGTLFAVSLEIREPGAAEEFHSRRPPIYEESWNKVLVELSDCLPAKSFIPEELDG